MSALEYGIHAKQGEHIMFDDKDIDFGLPIRIRKEILTYWKMGKSIHYISRKVKRNEHEVYFALYEFQMEGKIDNIARAFGVPSTLLVPGKEQLKRPMEIDINTLGNSFFRSDTMLKYTRGEQYKTIVEIHKVKMDEPTVIEVFRRRYVLDNRNQRNEWRDNR